jgi:hypothetical protein
MKWNEKKIREDISMMAIVSQVKRMDGNGNTALLTIK